MSAPLLETVNLSRQFTSGKQKVNAVDGVSLSVMPGETLGVVGESGCGKTTFGRLAMRLIAPSGGKVFFEGKDIWAMRGAEVKDFRLHMQMVFQDPFAALNPRMTIGRNIEELLIIHHQGGKADRRRAVLEVMDTVSLSESHYDRYPHEFSGGQRQRAVIARALVLKPRLVVCDEAVSALDVSVQSQILNLLSDLKKNLGLSYIFIAHGLHVVHHLSDRVAVMYMGQVVETAEAGALFASPRHPYTEALISSVPDPDGGGGHKRIPLQGDMPSLFAPPSGCRFHTRCPYAQALCRETPPVLTGDAHRYACHFPRG